MASTARCSKCGAPVSDEVAGGFCTACLLEEGLVPADLKKAPITLKYFGDYELIEEIARGGMGVVFKARQLSLKRIVAVKMILSGHLASETEAQRFRAEARAAAALQHPGIVAIHEVGEHEGLLFFSMDYVEGKNLAQLVGDGSLSATRAAECLRDIAEAIHYAHGHGVLHRDLKPSNVLIDANGKPHVTDFGLAKQLNDSQLSTSNAQLTVSGQLLGSPNFMPPEQAAGKHRELTPASDVYSLGALLYHLLTGRPPFLADSIPATLRLVCETEPVAPRLLAPAVPRDLETICLKCLEKDPARRYGTARELADELKRFLNDEPIHGRPINAAGKLWRWSRRNPMVASLTVGLLLVGVAGITGIVWQWQRAEEKAVQARRNAEDARRQQHLASEQELLARRRYYAAQMNLANQAWESGQLPRTLELLETQRPLPGQADLRGFEWFHLWELCNERNRFTLSEGRKEVNCIVFSPDENTLASGGGNGAIRLWDTANGRNKISIKVNSSVSSLAFTPNGKMLICGNWDSFIRIFDAATGDLCATLRSDGGPVRCLAVSRDTQTLAIGTESGVVTLWDLATRKLLFSLAKHKGPVVAIAFSSDNKTLVTGSGWGEPEGGKVVLWSLSSNPHPLWEVAQQATSLAFSKDDETLAAAVWDQILLLSTTDGQIRKALKGHLPRVNSVGFLPDGKTVVSCAEDRTVRLWPWDTKQGSYGSSRVIGGHLGDVLCLAVAPVNGLLASGASDGSVKLWNSVEGESSLVTRFKSGQPGAILQSLLLSPTNNSVFVITDAGTEVWNIATRRKQYMWSDASGIGALSSDGRLLATGKPNGLVKLWEADTRRLLATVQAHTNRAPAPGLNGLSSIAFSADGRLLATASFDDDTWARLWDTGAALKPIRSLPTPTDGVSAVGFSPDGKSLVVGVRHRGLFFDLSNRAGSSEIKFGNGAEVAAIAFSPDGELMATCGSGQAAVWDLRTRQLRHALKGQVGTGGIAFSPDGTTVATGGGASVVLWDVATGQERFAFKVEQPAKCVAFSRDGNTLLAASWDGTVRLWRKFRLSERDEAISELLQLGEPWQSDGGGGRSPDRPGNWVTLVESLNRQAKTNEAREVLRDRLAKFRAIQTNQLAFAQALDALAIRFAEQKDWYDAEPLAREAFSTQKTLGVVHPSAFRTFALALANLNRIPEVNELVRDEIAALKNSEENETLATAWFLQPVASDLSKAKAWDASASCDLEAFAIEEKRFAHDLGTLGATLGRLCASLDYARRFSEAEPLMQRRVDMLRKVHGNDDSHVSDALSWTAIIYEKDNKFAESEACARDGLAIELKLGKTNPSCLIRLVRALRRQHKDSEADGVIEKHLSGLRQTCARDPLGLAESLKTLAKTFVNTYEVPAGEKMLQEALATQRKTLTNSSPEIAATLESLCYALEKQKKTNEAAVFRKDLTALRAKLPNETPGK